MVVVDTLREDRARPRDGAERAGVLARLGRTGARFEQAVSSAAWTLPSMASLLTSQHPSRHGAVSRERRLPDELDTLAELLHRAGYQTAAFTGGAFVSPAYGLDQGFEVFDHEAEYRFQPLVDHVPLAWRLVKNRWMPLRWVLRHVNEFEGVPRLGRQVERWLERRDPGRPFFLLVHTYQVHDYYIYQPVPDDPLLAARGGPPEAIGRRLWMHPDELVRSGPEVVSWFHEVYRRRVEYVDGELDLLLQRVEAAGQGRALVTVLTSDHGEGFDAERDRLHHGARLHDDLLRVPLLLRAPGRVEAGRVVSEQVRLLDVLPTLLDLAGLPVPEGLSGRTLLPLLSEGSESPARLAWSEDHLGSRRISLRAAGWKAMDLPEGEELYALDADPLEDRPLPGPLPEPLRGPWQDRYRLLEPRTGVDRQHDPATLEQLRRLGY
jgi:arylsulfatase A-like enzyme